LEKKKRRLNHTGRHQAKNETLFGTHKEGGPPVVARPKYLGRALTKKREKKRLSIKNPVKEGLEAQQDPWKEPISGGFFRRGEHHRIRPEKKRGLHTGKATRLLVFRFNRKATRIPGFRI